LGLYYYCKTNGVQRPASQGVRPSETALSAERASDAEQQEKEGRAKQRQRGRAAEIRLSCEEGNPASPRDAPARAEEKEEVSKRTCTTRPPTGERISSKERSVLDVGGEACIMREA